MFLLERSLSRLWKHRLKKSKIWDFCKGVSLWFSSKIWNFFHLFIFDKQGEENVFEDILEKKAFLDYKNIDLKKSKYWYFSMVSDKNLKFFDLLLFVKVGQENVLLEYTAKDQKMCLRIFLKEKAFLDYKNIDWKIRKFDIFPKELVHVFGQKFENFRKKKPF